MKKHTNNLEDNVEKALHKVFESKRADGENIKNVGGTISPLTDYAHPKYGNLLMTGAFEIYIKYE